MENSTPAQHLLWNGMVTNSPNAPVSIMTDITAMAAVKIIYEVFGWLQNQGDLS